MTTDTPTTMRLDILSSLLPIAYFGAYIGCTRIYAKYESSLSSKQTTAIRKAIEALPWEYREVVTVLDGQSPSIPQLYPHTGKAVQRGKNRVMAVSCGRSLSSL